MNRLRRDMPFETPEQPIWKMDQQLCRSHQNRSRSYQYRYLMFRRRLVNVAALDPAAVL